MVQFNLLVRGLLAAAVALLPVSALASSDELYYSAPACQPFNGGGWHGAGSQGFAFQPTDGGMYNFDVDDSEALACPVPYFRDANNLEPITVRVVVEDRHPTRDPVAYLCGRGNTGAKACVAGTPFPTIYGVGSIELSLQPTASMRWVWIEVGIPDREDDGSRSNGASGMLGYRVFRGPE